MKSLLDEFKAFMMRGNVIDLAVAVVIGAAFTAIVNSIVNDLITPSSGLSWAVSTLAVSLSAFAMRPSHTAA